MKTIIKYQNRKLYDRENSCYITITELLKLPLGSFRVVTHSTFTDITTSTLLSALISPNLGSKIKVQVMEHCIQELS